MTMSVRKAGYAALWALPVTRKWGSVLYVRKHYRFPLREVVAMWAKVQRTFTPGRKTFLGTDETVVSAFFSAAAKRMYDESVTYSCVEGCCSVMWFNGGMSGSYGPAGCPCGDMDDPRDVVRGPLGRG